jgi:hypothetical protein
VTELAQTPDKTDLRKLPDLPQPKEHTQLIAEEILRVLGDTHSQAFYYLVAAKIPENIIQKPSPRSSMTAHEDRKKCSPTA